MTTPPRPDQIIDPPTAVLAPGGAAGVFKGRLVVISGTSTTGGSGLFVYNPTPGKNNLVYSVTAASGHDSYGNTVLAGSTTYSVQAGSYYALQIAGGSGAVPLVHWWLSSGDQTGSYSTIYALGISQSAGLTGIDLGSAAAFGLPPICWSNPLIAQDPTTPSNGAEVWHYVGAASQPAFGTGWSNVGGGFANLAFRMTIDQEVEIAGVVHHTNTAAQTIFTLPAAYRPTDSQQVTCLDANAASGIEISGAGAVEMLAAPSAAANTAISCRISLNV